jgi:RND family efflux transporter MFP subunit
MILTLALAGCGKEDARPPVRPVLYVEVQQQHEETLGRFAGTIQARYETVLGFRVNGRIARRFVDVGELVRAGGTLAALDPTDQENALRASQGDLARAEAQLINAQASARRQQELFDRGVGAKAELDQARAELSNARSTFDQAGASARQAGDRVGYSMLKTEFDGVVTAWHAEAGQVVSAGQQVVTLARPEVKEAVFDLPANLADRLDEQMRFDIAAQLDPSVRTEGRLRELEPQADALTRTRRARLSLEHTPKDLLLGTAVSIRLSRAIEPRSTLPAAAVQEVDGHTQVWVIDTERQVVNPRPVRVLARDENRVTVDGGLQPGEKVVSAGVNDLKAGQAIRIDQGVQP